MTPRRPGLRHRAGGRRLHRALGTGQPPQRTAGGFGATLFYVFVYTLWLKRTSTQNIVIGGPRRRARPRRLGRLACSDYALVLFGVIFYWTPPHFWALAIRYREDYEAAGVPMLPAVAGLRTTADAHPRVHGAALGADAPVRPGGGHGGPVLRGRAGAGRRHLDGWPSTSLCGRLPIGPCGSSPGPRIPRPAVRSGGRRPADPSGFDRSGGRNDPFGAVSPTRAGHD